MLDVYSFILKNTSLECAELKITETACVSDELCRLLKEEEEEEEEDRQIVSLGDSRVILKRVRDNIAFFKHANS